MHYYYRPHDLRAEATFRTSTSWYTVQHRIPKSESSNTAAAGLRIFHKR